MGSMMHMPWVLALIIVLAIGVGIGAYAAIRIAGAKAVGGDHPRTGTPPASRAAVAPAKDIDPEQ